MPTMTKWKSLLEQDEAWLPWLPLDYVTAKHVLVIAGAITHEFWLSVEGRIILLVRGHLFCEQRWRYIYEYMKCLCWWARRRITSFVFSAVSFLCLHVSLVFDIQSVKLPRNSGRTNSRKMYTEPFLCVFPWIIRSIHYVMNPYLDV